MTAEERARDMVGEWSRCHPEMRTAAMLAAFVADVVEAAEQAAREDAFREAAQWCDERARKFAKAMDETKDRPPRMMYVSGTYADIGHEFEYAAKAIRALAASDGNNQPDAPKGDAQ